MIDRPSTELPERYHVTAVVVAAVLGIGFVLHAVAGMGVVEIALVLVPVLVFAAPALAFYAWARRRGDL